ncbi:ATP-binding protein [Vibrio ponticus]|uniref:ATP-binding protein n=1 Tax=Vibrio ponticus TaxID=265668 RepID=UPI0021A71E7C|nr:transporter substrate-binding domain-containing protein [Vibrio ponticus]
MLKVGVTTTSYPPYWTGSVLLPQGLTHDVAMLISSHLNVEIEYLAFKTIADVKDAIKAGEVDLAIGYLKTPQREQDFLFSEPVYKEAVAGWISNQALEFNDPSELRWACLKGMSLCSILEQNRFNDVLHVDDYASFYEYLSSGKVDALIGFYSSFLNYFVNMNIDGQNLYFDHRFGDFESHIILNKGQDKLKLKLDKLIKTASFQQSLNDLEEFYHNHYYPKDLYEKWFHSDESEIVVKYTLDNDLFPYSYKNDDGEVVGYVHDIIRRIQEITPLEFKYVPSEGRDLQEMLMTGEIDLIPVARRENYDSSLTVESKNSIEIKYVLIKSLEKYSDIKYALLDRFNYNTENSVPEGFEVFDSIEQLLRSLANGEVTHAYVNKYLVESILHAQTSVPFRVSSVMGKYHFNTNASMLMRKDNSHLNLLLEEAFLMLSPRELEGFWARYNTVEYRFGYHQETVNKILLAFLVIFVVSAWGVYAFALRMRSQVDGAHKKSELSEVHRRWLVDIIDNIPNYVCIRDESGTVELSNRSFRNLCRSVGAVNENQLLDLIINNAEVELHSDDSKHLHVCKENHPLDGTYFHVVNNQVTHYVDNMALYMTVLTDITELKEKEQKLLKANKDAETSIQQKTNFLAVISHELRTPISGILGLMEMLKHRTYDELGKDILNNASASTGKLKLLVDDILDFSKLDANQLSINIERHNLALELSPILKSFESLAERKGIGFYLDWVPTPYIFSNVDFLRFSQIVSNVLSNSVKFTEFGSIVVKLQVNESLLTMDIKDSGIGMVEGELEHIFDPFVQAQDNIARKYGGTGLGMSIVKNLIDLMQGTIEIKSAKNIGTSVHISLPIVSCPYQYANSQREFTSTSHAMTLWLKSFDVEADRILQPENFPERRNVYPDEVLLLMTKDDLDSDEQVVVEQWTKLTGKLLVVEDDPINRFLVKLQLDTLGIESVIVNQGDQALALIQDGRHQFDALLTDCHMPGMNGFELTTVIRNSLCSLSRIPIVAFTADNSELITKKAAKVGIEHILYKPYELFDLHKVLSAVLPHQSEVEQVSVVTSSGEHALLSQFSEEDQVLMAQAIIDSLSMAISQFNEGSEEIAAITHRVKGAAGALQIMSVVELCDMLSKEPNNKQIKKQLIQCLNDILDEAKQYSNQLATSK